ncbi:CO(2)-response secreted protease [Citrus sinensis]|uniref:CO(2)-response secreted protease n=2 Tax=Citrus TaxID=2706 RepID=A0ACB8KE82_CITSI|nr:CO(2)-response secreted protease [Citrus x clementina]KAH9752730.1 CO(2)-response secreted protease [Citrus sinensis]
MASSLMLLQLLPFLCLHWLIFIASTSSNEIPKPYIVYMGSSSKSNLIIQNGEDVEIAKLNHMQLLSSIIPSEESERLSLIHHYKHAFKGFSAILTDSEASALSGHDHVVSVFPDPVLQLHTTRSWDFLAAAAKPAKNTWFNHKYHKAASDIVIGVIDTGIWPESPSFNDQGMGEIPSRWKGVCMESPDFKKSHCNRKLIGARHCSRASTNKDNSGSSRDPLGHGTHTASTAAGNYVSNAIYFGLAGGTARGGSPFSRIASYKACKEGGCSGAAILQAIDDAIHDGVDIISISIGLSNSEADYMNDPIAIGALHAQQRGVVVICSAGNDGPYPFTVANTAPWLFTVAASTIDRDFQSTVLLGNGKAIKGTAISLSNLSRSKTYPLAYGKAIAVNSTLVSQARSCRLGSIDPKKVAGKILVCIHTDPMDTRGRKIAVAENVEAQGLIFINDDEKIWPTERGILPYAEVGKVAGFRIINYINSNKNPTATILPTVTIPRHRPAPVVAYFSSRGPGLPTENILKPDVAAPGVAVLAAIVPRPDRPGGIPAGEKPATYALRSGTSMACPHVTGAAAFIKSVRRKWTYSMIKSALMTTATVYDNTGTPLTNSSGNNANPHEMGAGEINPLKALNPGLVFKTTIKDYLRFLCYYGYSRKNIRSMTNTTFNCPKKSSAKLISNINYPSISISKLARQGAIRTVKRTVTNVGSLNATYISMVNAPSGLAVKVFPQKLTFVEGIIKLSFRASFFGKEASSGYNYGSITWSDDQHSVRMMFAVDVE